MKPRLFLQLLSLALLVALSSGAGCNSDDTGGVVTPPLVIRATDPWDESFVGTGADSFALNLNVVFRRGSGPDDARLTVYPSPLRAGEITRSSTGRNWTWNDVWLEAAQGAYFWLIDGPEMPQPTVVRIEADPSASVGVGYSGTLRSSNAAILPLDGTLVFSVDPLDGFNPLDPGTFNALEPLAVSEVDSLGPAGERAYAATYLDIGTTYYVIAILDTNGDALYDPTVDAWGYRELPEGGPEPIPADLAVPLGQGGTEYRPDVDFTLFPAAVMKSRAEAALSSR